MDDIRRALAALCAGLAVNELIMAYGLWFIVGAWAPEGLVHELSKAAVWGWAAWRVLTAPRWGGALAALGTAPWLALWAWEVQHAPILVSPARGPALAAAVALGVIVAARGGAPWSPTVPDGLRPGLLAGLAALTVIVAARDPLVAAMTWWMWLEVPFAVHVAGVLAVSAGLVALAAWWPLASPARAREAAPPAALGVLAAAALVGVELSGLRVARGLFYEERLGGVAALLYFVVVTLALMAATRHVAGRGSTGAAQRAGLLVAAVVVAGWFTNTTLNVAMYTWTFSPPRVVGQFPFEGGTTHTYQLGTYAPADVHVLPDGTRNCGSGPGERVVALIGDSFQEGQGLPDEHTLCWTLRDQLAPEHPGWRWVNLGQSGSGLTGSYETARFALAAHHADVLLMSFTLRDDGRPFEITTLQRAMSTRPFFVLNGLTDVKLALEVLVLYHETFASELYQQLVMVGGLRRLSALAAEAQVPIVVELHHMHFPPACRETTRLRAMVDADPWLVWGTDRGLARDPAQPDLSTQIPGDGHPSAWGNTLRARRLNDAVITAMARAEARPPRGHGADAAPAPSP